MTGQYVYSVYTGQYVYLTGQYVYPLLYVLSTLFLSKNNTSLIIQYLHVNQFAIKIVAVPSSLIYTDFLILQTFLRHFP